MALARLALRNLQHRAISSASTASTVGYGIRVIGDVQKESFFNKVLRSFATATSDGKEQPKGTEVAVSQARKSKISPRKQRRWWLWRKDNRDFVPALQEFFPSGLGNALMQATENINRLFDNMNLAPWSLSGRVKEKDDCYKLRFDMPGLAKDEVKITVDDGILRIKGEHKDETEEEDDDKYWSSRSYGYYDTGLVLPEDAKSDEIKAELKDGVLSIKIPRTEKAQKEVQEVKVH